MMSARAMGVGLVSVIFAACGGTVGVASSVGSTGTGGSSSSSTSGAGGGATSSSSQASSSSSGSTGTGSKGCGMAAMPGLHDETIMSGGLARTFHVHVPPGYDASKPTMLVFIFHGFTQHGVGGDIFAIEYLSQMDAVSDAQSFLVVYPDGVGNGWNAGLCCGTAVSSNVDDVGFFDDMLAHLGAEYCVDAKRVYAGGLSNGGFFSNRLGCERADVVAAIGPVAGPLDITPCNPSRPMPVFEVHGTTDPVVYYDGGSASGADSVPAAIATWESLDKCTDPVAQTVYMNGAATCTAETMCAGGSAVELCVIQNGGHEWPGGKDDFLGNFSSDLDTSNQMIAFFNAHPLP